MILASILFLSCEKENDDVLFGKENDGNEWSSTYKCWFQHDTLAIKHDGGWEYYNEYFIRVK